MNKEFLILENVYKSFNGETVLNNVSLKFKSQGFIGIYGASGSGKSTLLNLLAGFLSPDEGRIVLGFQDFSKLKKENITKIRYKNIGFLEQKATLLEDENALDNLLLPLKGFKGKTLKKKKRAQDFLAAFSLKEVSKIPVKRLSGGERQRLALGRALMKEPTLLLADEPTSALDEVNAHFVFKVLRNYSSNALVIVVSHDLELLNRYADEIYVLEEGKIALQRKEEIKSEPLPYILPLESKKERKPRIYHFFDFAIAYFKGHRFRYLFVGAFLSFSLLTLGLTFHVATSLENSLWSSFHRLSGENEIIMQKKVTETYSKKYSCPLEEAEKLTNFLPELVKGFGVGYLANFETFFPEENGAYILLEGTEEQLIPSLSFRSLNDFQWLDDYLDKEYYPSLPSVLESEQIVLGLPYEQMANLCYHLRILRSYENLGLFLKEKPLPLLFKFQNSNWKYHDEQLLKIVAVTRAEVPTIYHYDRLWNQMMIEEKMRFPTNDHEDLTYPWILWKVPYLRPKNNTNDFLQKLRKYSEYDRYVFDPLSYRYLGTLLEPGKEALYKRYYLYWNSVQSDEKEIHDSLKEEKSLSSFSFHSMNTYSFYPEALSQGFSDPFFISDKKEELDKVKDFSEVFSSPLDVLSLDLSNDVVLGNYLLPRSENLLFSSDFERIISGRKPLSLDEIAISSSLADKFSSPSFLHLLLLETAFQSGEKTYFYQHQKVLKVVGVVENEEYKIYGDQYWTIDFFREHLGISSFDLPFQSILLNLKENVDSERTLAHFKEKYPSYDFAMPSLVLEEAISDVSGYLTFLLGVVSFSSFIFSSLLLVVTIFLLGKELIKVGLELFHLGYQKSAILRAYQSAVLLLLLPSFVSSSFLLLILENLINRGIASSFSSGGVMVLDFSPLLLSFLLMVVAFLISSFFLFLNLKKEDLSGK